jgi:hypothetical protein
LFFEGGGARKMKQDNSFWTVLLGMRGLRRSAVVTVVTVFLAFVAAGFETRISIIGQEILGDLSQKTCYLCHELFGSVEDKQDSGFDNALGAAWDGASVGGYASKLSVSQGGKIDLHVSTDIPRYSITIWREGAERQLMKTVPDLLGGQYDCTNRYEIGCGWPVAYSLWVPHSWPSGIYTVDIPTSIKGTMHVVFSVRERDPGTTSPILFLSSTNTLNAYSPFGGRSLYGDSASHTKRAFKVSFDRPMKSIGPLNSIATFEHEKNFASWAEQEGYSMEYATTSDLEFLPNLLNHYQVVVIAYHSEYWSWAMRHRLKTFIDKGGRFINLSGNTMWWQVKYENDGRTLVCYKDYHSDPAVGQKEETDLPSAYPILDIESSITGVQWCSGGYFNVGATFNYKHGYGGFWLQRATHWLFEGTGLKDGDIFGKGLSAKTSVIGKESDGTSFNCGPNGRSILGTLRNSGTPENFTILGVAPVALNDIKVERHGKDVDRDLGFAVMGIYTTPAGGAVFSGSSMGWADALADPVVAQVTRNVLNGFLSGSVPPEPKSSSDTEYFFYDRFNCDNLYHDGIRPSYDGPKWYEGVPGHNYVNGAGDLTKLKYTKACGIGEGSGLEISIDHAKPFVLTSKIKPNWQSADVLYTRMYLDFTNLLIKDNDHFVLMRLLYDNGHSRNPKNQTGLQIGRIEGKLSVRYVDSPTANHTPWVTIASNAPVLVETMWDKLSNNMSLYVDGNQYAVAVDLSQREAVNRVDIMLDDLDSGTNGTFCLDELAFDDNRIGAINSAAAIKSQ